MGNDWAVALFGLASAASWGAADFNGGLATRRANPFVVVAASQAVGLGLLVVLALLVGEPFSALSSLLWGGAAGVFGGLGLAALYRALAVGQMGVAAPVTAVLSAALPVLFAALTIGIPSGRQISGFALALLSVWLLARPNGAHGRPQGLGLALLAGAGFGGFLILIHQADVSSVLWPLAAARCASLVLMLPLAGIALRRAAPAAQGGRRLWLPVLLSGILDVGGNAFFVLAGHVGRLDVAAVLSSLYPATTVLLAWLLLKERLTRSQTVAIALTLLAILLITVA
ncbi:MAG: EamA family transporter [Chloroflexota bacterium]|nr:EamA family transporter [Chloroflexota bacterium]